MKKEITIVLEVDTDSKDEFIMNDLEQEINCCCNIYTFKTIEIRTPICSVNKKVYEQNN